MAKAPAWCRRLHWGGLCLKPYVPETQSSYDGWWRGFAYSGRTGSNCCNGYCGAIKGTGALASFWMRAIETDEKVIEFYPSGWNYLLRDLRFADTPRGRRPIPLDPKQSDTEKAQRYRFLCGAHDVCFNNVDNLTETQDYSLRNLNWAVYRSVLAQQWRVESRRWALKESEAIGPSLHNVPRADGLKTSVFSILNESLGSLSYYKQNLQNCLEPENCAKCNGIQCSFVTHTVLHLKGKPKLAASTFSLGLRDHENWGLNVVPLADGTGHDVIWHYFGGQRGVMEQRISLQRKAQGKKREEMVSQCILRFADALVVNPEWWDGIGDNRRTAIVEMISAETGVAIGTPEWVSSRLNRANTPILDLPNPRQLNLFRGD